MRLKFQLAALGGFSNCPIAWLLDIDAGSDQDSYRRRLARPASGRNGTRFQPARPEWSNPDSRFNPWCQRYDAFVSPFGRLVTLL